MAGSTAFSRLYNRITDSMALYGIIIRTARKSSPRNDPSITAGDGVPATDEPDGSMWLRKGATDQDALCYLRASGAWYPVAAGGSLDSEITLTDALAWYAGTMGDDAFDEIATAIGGTSSTVRAYSSTNYVANDDVIVVGIGKLDTGLKTAQDAVDALELMVTQDVRSTASPAFAGLTINGAAKITGKLVLTGSAVMVDAEHQSLRANYLYQNIDYTTVSAQTGGRVINRLPTATAITTVGAGVVVAGVDGVSNPTITTTEANGLVDTDIVQISGSANNGENDGPYEVFSHALNVLTLRSTANGINDQAELWSLGQLTANAGDVGMTITKIGVAVDRVGTDGRFEAGFGNQTPIVFSDYLLVSDIGATVSAQSRVQANDIADPGNGQAIVVTSSGVCMLTTGGAGETRTLAVPTFIGQRIGLCLDVDGGGDCVITVASAFNQDGDVAITLNDAGDYVELVGAEIAGAFRWREASDVERVDTEIAAAATLGTNAQARVDTYQDQLVTVVITAPDVGGGGTDCALSLVTRRAYNNATAVATICQLWITASTVQYQPVPPAKNTVTFAAATVGSIIASGDGWALVQTDAVGAFACTMANSADETLFVHADTATSPSSLDYRCVVVGCVADSVTWAA